MVLAETDVPGLLFWLAMALVLLVVGVTWALRLKRQMSQDDEPAGAMGFTLSDLRQMHRAGQLSDDEFAKAKGKIVGAAQEVPERAAAADVSDRDSADAIRARRLNRQDPRRGFEVLPPEGGPDGEAAPKA